MKFSELVVGEFFRSKTSNENNDCRVKVNDTQYFSFDFDSLNTCQYLELDQFVKLRVSLFWEEIKQFKLTKE